MAHGNAVIDSYRIELSCKAALFLYLGLDDLAYLMQMRVTGHELGKRVDYSNNRFAELLALHTRSHP